jgi:hypothetical protein
LAGAVQHAKAQAKPLDGSRSSPVGGMIASRIDIKSRTKILQRFRGKNLPVLDGSNRNYLACSSLDRSILNSPTWGCFPRDSIGKLSFYF